MNQTKETSSDPDSEVKNSNPTQMELRILFSYDPKTGNLVNLTRRSQSVKPGMVAGTLTKTGHIRIIIRKKKYLAHRLVWVHLKGEWPDGPLDHINGRPDDNRIENLRLATLSQNSMNSGRRADNTSGFKGVFWNKKNNNWVASIRQGTRNFTIGSFAQVEDAASAVREARIRLHGDFANHGEEPSTRLRRILSDG